MEEFKTTGPLNQEMTEIEDEFEDVPGIIPDNPLIIKQCPACNIFDLGDAETCETCGYSFKG